jgi:hypothetical protein
VTFAILATGPSMSQAVADYVRGKCKAICVSDAYKLAPWAEAMVSQDKAWWEKYPEAKQFAGRKFSTHRIDGVEQILPGPIQNGTNSGLLAMEVAKLLGAKRILLLGMDMQGTHYFGPHPEGLRNTSEGRYRQMLAQFDRWPGKVEVINCTPGSRLRRYPMARIEDVL